MARIEAPTPKLKPRGLCLGPELLFGAKISKRSKIAALKKYFVVAKKRFNSAFFVDVYVLHIQKSIATEVTKDTMRVGSVQAIKKFGFFRRGLLFGTKMSRQKNRKI